MCKLFFTEITIGFAFLLITVMAMPALANQTLVITSDSLNADRQENTAVFEGSVVARGENMVLSAAKMTVSYDEGGSVSTLLAEGSVKLVRGLQVLTSKRAVYDLASKSLVFTGDPRAVDEGNVLIGDRISYYLEDDRIKVEKSTMFIEQNRAVKSENDE